jgi:hypothetical protein
MAEFSAKLPKRGPKKLCTARKKLEAVIKKLAKSGRKEAGKYLYSNLDVKPYNYV